jgi:hypothetical protein
LCIFDDDDYYAPEYLAFMLRSGSIKALLRLY